MPDWNAVRREFPALSRCTFLNTATFGQAPRAAIAAIQRHLSHRDETACHDFLDWFEEHHLLRAKLAALVNCESDDIAYTPHAAFAMALLLNGIDWHEGDEILTLQGEFPIQIYAPLAHGVKLVEAGWPDLLSQISPRTRLVAVSLMNYTTGFVTPLAELAAAARNAGALFYVDGTQGVGALRFDFAAIQPDMLSVNTYKWMLTPNGVAFIAVHPRLRPALKPLSVGWRSDCNWRNVAELNHGAPEFSATAEKYEGGMLPSMQLYALDAVLDLMLGLTPAVIEARVLGLAEHSRAILERHGGQVAHPGSPIQAALFAGKDASALEVALNQRGILASARHGRLRISTHFYNTDADLTRLDDALTALL